MTPRPCVTRCDIGSSDVGDSIAVTVTVEAAGLEVFGSPKFCKVIGTSLCAAPV